MNLNFSEDTEINTIEYLTYRITALEASNASLEKENKYLKEENLELRKMYIKTMICM